MRRRGRNGNASIYAGCGKRLGPILATPYGGLHLGDFLRGIREADKWPLSGRGKKVAGILDIGGWEVHNEGMPATDALTAADLRNAFAHMPGVTAYINRSTAARYIASIRYALDHCDLRTAAQGLDLLAALPTKD